MAHTNTDNLGSAIADAEPRLGVHWKAIKELRKFVLPAMARDASLSRPYLNALHVIDGQLVATDGKRMHVAPLSALVEGPVDVTIPVWVVDVLENQHDAVGIVRVTPSGEYRIRISWRGDATVIETFIPSTPDLLAAVPNTDDIARITTTPRRARAQIKAIDDAGRGVALRVADGTVDVIGSADVDGGHDVIVNADYLRDALRVEPKHTAEITVATRSAGDPVVLRGSLGTAVVMPKTGFDLR